MSTLTLDYLIAAQDAAHLRVRRIAHPLHDTVLPVEAAEAIAEARRALDEAQALVERVRVEAAAIRQEAAAAGRQEGLASVADALVTAQRHHAATLAREEADLVRLAVELARRIVGRHLDTDPTAMRELVAQALTHAATHRRIEIRVHPTQVARLQQEAARLLARLSAEHLTLSGDPTLPLTGCRIHTEAGIIEADLDIQLRVLAERLGVEG